MSSIITRIRLLESTLKPAELKLAQFIRQNPFEMLHRSETEYVELVGVNLSTLKKFISHLGLSNFNELKLQLARETVPPLKPLSEAPSEDDSPEILLRKVIGENIALLDDTLQILDPHAVQRAADVIATSARVNFIGAGLTAQVAEDAAIRFTRLGINCQYYGEAFAQIASTSLLGSSDTIMAYTLDGKCNDILYQLELAKSLGCITIVVTQFSRSPIVSAADIVLYVSSNERRNRIPSTVHLFTLTNILWQFIAIKNHNETLKKIQRVEQAFVNRRK